MRLRHYRQLEDTCRIEDDGEQELLPDAISHSVAYLAQGTNHLDSAQVFPNTRTSNMQDCLELAAAEVEPLCSFT